MSLWKWERGITAVEPRHRVELGEGETALVRSRRLGEAFGMSQLYFKLETTNPSGSFKDRFASVAVSHMLSVGQTRCIATSSGNTGAALAAYCAAAGLRCDIAIVETAPMGKLSQMLAYDAHIYRVRGFGLNPIITEQVIQRLEQLAQAPDAALQISAFKYSPVGMSGVRTLGYELMSQLPECRHVFCPTGGGGLSLGVAEAYQWDDGLARVHVVQPVGNDTISGPLRDGDESARSVNCSAEISGLQVASVIDGNEAIKTCRQTGGTGFLVEDDWTWEIQARLAETEGIFTEPAGAIATAAAIQAVQQGTVSADEPMVCLVTGSGFKDPNSVERMNSIRRCPLIDADEIV